MQLKDIKAVEGECEKVNDAANLFEAVTPNLHILEDHVYSALDQRISGNLV